MNSLSANFIKNSFFISVISGSYLKIKNPLTFYISVLKNFEVCQIYKWQQGMCRMFLRKLIESLKIVEKLGFRIWTMVVVRKNRSQTLFLKEIIRVLRDYVGKIGKKRLQIFICNSRKILIFLWNRKAWLRSQAIDKGNIR